MANFDANSEIPKDQSSQTAINPYQRRDPLYIHPSNNPGTQIMNFLLNLSNYLVWSRAIRIALKTKNKLGFIDGTCVPPKDTTSKEFMRWSDADSLVVWWLHDSMTKDLMEAYMFTPTSRQLWLDLEEKFGISDRSKIYDLRKQLIQIVQGKDSLALYSNKQKKLIDELNCLDPKDPCVCNGCTCGGYKKLVDSVTNNDTYNFLRGLDESYSNTVSTILLMEPIPSYNKVYSLVTKIEGQKIVATGSNRTIEASALVAKFIEQLKTEVKQNSDESGFNSTMIAQLVQMEVQKLMKSKIAAEESPDNTSYFADFAGNFSNSCFKSDVNWIIDSGASSHVTVNIKLLKDLKTVKSENTLTFPDGSVKTVTLIGCVVQDLLSKKVVAQGKIVKNLFVLFINQSFDHCILNVDSSINKGVQPENNTGSVVWHNRLGHPSSDVLLHLPVNEPTSDNSDSVSQAENVPTPSAVPSTDMSTDIVPIESNRRRSDKNYRLQPTAVN
ncbi:Integrase, catalytic core [Senna tora]|uniref:Integrase, catalytic core n=1 Tax=Senna tora TaxID=362788 RepID=A0A834WIK7_9FABA|nr:Integrase, catalytic core [Senna tora]